MNRNTLLFKVLILLFIFSACGTERVESQILEPVKWKFYVKTKSADEVKLIAEASIDEKWHLYGQYSEPAGGTPLSFEYEASDAYSIIGKVLEWPKPKKEYDDIMMANIQTFENKAYFTQVIKVKSQEDFKLSGYLQGQVCEELCIQMSEDFEFKVPGLQKLQKEYASLQGEDTSTTEEPDTALAFVDTNSSDLLDSAVTEADTLVSESELTSDSGGDESDDNWIIIFLIAFGAGLLTIITPCVFPMVPLTVSFFMKGNKTRAAGLKQAYFFGFSIILIFAVLGLLLTVIFGKDAMYVISTHWIPNMIFFLIFITFALSFFGLFEITLPSRLVTKSDEQADKGGLTGVFFVAFTTVLVSFSCTGPILGAALIELSSGSSNSLVFLISMLGFAIGFALPFTLLAMFPQALSKMKSGSWLNSVKIVFGFLEIALGLKFLSMADLGANWGILDRETFLAIWIVTFTLLGFYLLGKLKFKGDNDVKVISVPRIFLAIITFSFVMYMIPGMWGAPLKTLSGYLPPLTSQDFDLERIIVENNETMFAAYPLEDDMGEIKYADELHLPTGFKGFFDLEQAKAYSKKVNKPIFVDFTGKTCANCREMENNVWNAPEVKKLLTEEFVMVALYADANWIKLEEDEWFTSGDGKLIKRLGHKNLDYQITRFNINAQPYYVLMDHEENVLTKENKAYDPKVSNFVDFLMEGLENYNKKYN